jgi:predicted  nucleic acid-binding Zn-ribbon protein
VANAPAADQQRLLIVQDADTRANQAHHRRATLPVIARIEELSSRALDFDDERVARGTEVTDLKREVAKAEDDVESVRARARRDQERLDSGQSSAKDLQALQSELEVLAKRQADLEDVEIEVMERLEAAETAQASAATQHEAIAEQIARLQAERTAAEAEIDEELEAIAVERSAALEGLDVDLVALYEKIRAQHGGVGAAALTGTTCEGCHMPLNPVDVARFNAAPPDQIIRCEECGRILVRKATA